MVRRLQWSLLPVPVAVLGWLLLLGWRAEKWRNADGSLGGPYRPWEVVAFVVLVGATVWVSARRGHAVVATVAATLTTTALAVADWSGTDDSGLWAVGAALAFLGTLVGTGSVAVIANARSRSHGRTWTAPK